MDTASPGTALWEKPGLAITRHGGGAGTRSPPLATAQLARRSHLESGKVLEKKKPTKPKPNPEIPCGCLKFFQLLICLLGFVACCFFFRFGLFLCWGVFFPLSARNVTGKKRVTSEA